MSSNRALGTRVSFTARGTLGPGDVVYLCLQCTSKTRTRLWSLDTRHYDLEPAIIAGRDQTNKYVYNTDTYNTHAM